MRRLLITIAVACLATSSPVLARPKVAVTPLRGDSDDKIGEILRDALAGKLAVVPPKDVARAMDKLGLSGELDEQDVQRLRTKTSAAVVVQGKLGRAGTRKTLKVSVWVRGKQPSDFTVQYKSTGSEKFREGVRDAIVKRIGSLDDLDDDDRPKKRVASDDDDKPKKKKASADDDDRPKKKKKADDDDRPKKRIASADDDRPKKKKASADDDDRPKKKKKRVASDDDDDDRPRKRRKRGGDGDGEGVSARSTPVLVAARVDAGLSVGIRRLTYTVAATSTTRPPKVSTGAGAGRIEAELYPFAFSNRRSKLAGLGIVGDYDKTFGLSIDVPNTMTATPIDQAHYSIGARYQIAVGSAAIGLGLRYARRHYIADRSGLAMPTLLDAPDVDYAAIAPGVTARLRAAPKVTLFAALDAMLILSTGAIQSADNYGAADVFGIDGDAGVDIALGKQLGLRFAAEYSQINLSFKGNGAMATARGVSAATDRAFGMAATLAAMF